MSKRVAILLPNLTGGGAERVALAVAKDLLDGGHQVDLLVAQAVGALLPLVPDGARLIDLKAHRMIASLRPLSRYLRIERPDVLNAHMWPISVVAIMAHRLARSKARLVVSDHTILSRHASGAVQRRLLRWTTRLFYPLADARTICSQTSAEDLARLSGISRSRIEIVYSPIARPERSGGAAEAEPPWKGEGPRILTVGNLHRVKNHALLLQGFARLRSQGAELMILGEGPLRAELEGLAARLGVADRVTLPGFIPDPWPFYASADLFVLTSDYEGFGIVLVEAMQAGLKIVSTHCGGPGEILDGGRYGRLVPCGDADALAAAMDAALAEPADAEGVSQRAKAAFGSQALKQFRSLLVGGA